MCVAEKEFRFLAGWVEPDRLRWVSPLYPTYENYEFAGTSS
jgi:hypothetical protein